jgi:hypothetical protein
MTPSPFERRSPPTELELVFKTAFGTLGKAAAYFGFSRQTIGRWTRLKPPPPPWVLDALKEPVHKKVHQAHAAQDYLNLLMRQPSRPPRKLSGCCARYERTVKPW